MGSRSCAQDFEEGLRWHPRPLTLLSALDVGGVAVTGSEAAPTWRFPLILEFEVPGVDTASNIAVNSFNFSHEIGFSDIEGVSIVEVLCRHLRAEGDSASDGTRDDLDVLD